MPSDILKLLSFFLLLDTFQSLHTKVDRLEKKGNFY